MAGISRLQKFIYLTKRRSPGRQVLESFRKMYTFGKGLKRINVFGDDNIQVNIRNRAGISNCKFTNGTSVLLFVKVFVSS
jgi:hypothetical protein